jgi:hypothetical protein
MPFISVLDIIVQSAAKRGQGNKSVLPANIDVSALPTGFYIFRAMKADGTTTEHNFIKE